MRPSPITAHALPAAARLHRPLLALHAAMEVEALWRAVRGVMRAAFAPHRVTLFPRPPRHGRGARRPHRSADRAPGGVVCGARETEPVLALHRGQPRREVLPLRGGAAAARGVCALGILPALRVTGRLGQGRVGALLVAARGDGDVQPLPRARAAPTSRDAELALLRDLQPFVGTAIARVRRLHTERLARRGLEEFNRHVPVGLVFLDWSLRVEFANPEAHRLCARWNFGPEAARALNPRDAFAPPPAVLDACRALRAAVLAREPRAPSPQPGDVTHVEPAADSGCARKSPCSTTRRARSRSRASSWSSTRAGGVARAGGHPGREAEPAPRPHAARARDRAARVRGLHQTPRSRAA